MRYWWGCKIQAQILQQKVQTSTLKYSHTHCILYFHWLKAKTFFHFIAPYLCVSSTSCHPHGPFLLFLLIIILVNNHLIYFMIRSTICRLNVVVLNTFIWINLNIKNRWCYEIKIIYEVLLLFWIITSTCCFLRLQHK